MFNTWSADPSLCVGPVCGSATMNLNLSIPILQKCRNIYQFILFDSFKAEQQNGLVVVDVEVNCLSFPAQPLIQATGSLSTWTYGTISMTVSAQTLFFSH
jgi:hypothetical protein